MKKHTLVVRNLAQKILWDEELAGQISDGAWENASPLDHWEVWCDAEVVVGDNVGRSFYARKDNYNLNRKDLLDAIGDRMLAAVQAQIPGYAEADMRRDLKDLKTIIKTHRSATEEEKEREVAAIREETRRREAVQAKRNASGARVKELAEELGVNVGYVSTQYVSRNDGLSYEKVVALVEAALAAGRS